MAGGIASSALFGAAGNALASDAASATAADASEVDWDKEADFVVVGSGAAGLGAALTAIDQGASVIVVEKGSSLCGDAAYSHGVIMGCQSRMDKEAGFDVSVQQVEDENLYVNEHPDMEYAHFTHEQSGATLDWLENHGVAFDNPEGFINKCYSELPIYHELDGWGAGFYTLADQLQEKAQEVLTETRAYRLVVDGEDRRVVGVICSGADGSDIAIKANAGVMLACGGYGANNGLFATWDPRGKGMTYEGRSTNTGDGLMMAAQLGAVILTRRGEGVFSSLVDYHTPNYVNYNIHGDGGILVGADGKRFTRETSSTIYRQTKLPFEVYTKMTSDGADHMTIIAPECQAIQDTIDAGVQVFSDDTIEGLAEQLGIDPTGLADEIERYNGFCASGVDEDFGRDGSSNEALVPFEQGPFYGIQIVATVTITSGGLKINNDSQVMRYCLYEDGSDSIEPIPGLYAGGEISFYEFHWGFALSNALTRGRAAATHALANA